MYAGCGGDMEGLGWLRLRYGGGDTEGAGWLWCLTDVLKDRNARGERERERNQRKAVKTNSTQHASGGI